MGNSRRIRSETCTKSTKDQKTAFYFSDEISFYEWRKLWFDQKVETTGQISLISLTKIAMALDIADELRNIFTQVPYRNIQEVINERN